MPPGVDGVSSRTNPFWRTPQVMSGFVMRHALTMIVPTDCFIMNEAHWLTLDVVYLIAVRSGAIVGARVGGQIVHVQHREPSNPLSYVKPKLLVEYSQGAFLSDDFLQLDRKNFILSSAEIQEVEMSTRKSRWTGPLPNSGVLKIKSRNAQTRKLILLGKQDFDGLRAKIQSCGIPISPHAA